MTKLRLMIDSGAYTVWTQGKTIALADYIAFLKDCRKSIKYYIALDVLPGTYGKKRSQADVDHAAEASYRNLQVMKDAGLRPIPVFHRGEDFQWLERLIKDDEPYLCISPLTDSPFEIKRRWLRKVFKVIPKDIWVHGLGVTDLRLMQELPWRSVDSTSWAMSAALGQVPIPTCGGRLFTLVGFGNADRMAFDALGPASRKYIEQYLQSIGLSLAEMRYSFEARARASLAYWMRIKQPRIYFVHNPNSRPMAEALYKAKAPRQLMSYWYLTEQKWLYPLKPNLNDLVEQGIWSVAKGSQKLDWNNPTYVYRRKLQLQRRIHETNS